MRERAKSAQVTGTAGALLLAVAVVLLILTAPAHSRPSPVGPPAFPVRTVARVIQSPEPATGPAQVSAHGSGHLVRNPHRAH
jgi:hypothetical protein